MYYRIKLNVSLSQALGTHAMLLTASVAAVILTSFSISSITISSARTVVITKQSFIKHQAYVKLNSVALVREPTIPTERPPLVGEF
jgi:hypothetical protein